MIKLIDFWQGFKTPLAIFVHELIGRTASFIKKNYAYKMVLF
jgi:hypothetical protein